MVKFKSEYFITSQCPVCDHPGTPFAVHRFTRVSIYFHCDNLDCTNPTWGIPINPEKVESEYEKIS